MQTGSPTKLALSLLTAPAALLIYTTRHTFIMTSTPNSPTYCATSSSELGASDSIITEDPLNTHSLTPLHGSINDDSIATKKRRLDTNANPFVIEPHTSKEEASNTAQPANTTDELSTTDDPSVITIEGSIISAVLPSIKEDNLIEDEELTITKEVPCNTNEEATNGGADMPLVCAYERGAALVKDKLDKTGKKFMNLLIGLVSRTLSYFADSMDSEDNEFSLDPEDIVSCLERVLSEPELTDPVTPCASPTGSSQRENKRLDESEVIEIFALLFAVGLLLPRVRVLVDAVCEAEDAQTEEEDPSDMHAEFCLYQEQLEEGCDFDAPWAEAGDLVDNFMKLSSSSQETYAKLQHIELLELDAV